MRFLNFLVLLILTSCGSREVRKTVDTGAYQTSGVEKYFLPELPNWANFSAAGACFKKNSIHYMDFEKLKDAYQLTYQQTIELQAQYNEKLEDYFKSASSKFLKPIEEASFFSNTLEQVRGGVRRLKLPSVNHVEVVWLESFIMNDQIEEIKKQAKAGRFDNKLPILFSSCHSHQSLTEWLSENGLEEVGFYLLTSEWLSPFSSQGEKLAGLKINLPELLGKQIKYSIYTSEIKNDQPSELLLP